MPRRAKLPLIRLVHSSPEPEVPSLPSGLLRSSYRAWDDYWASPIAQLADPADTPALIWLFRLRDELDRALKALPKNRIVAGYSGQPRPNPLYAIAASLGSEVRQLEDRFGLSAKSRMALGVVAGQAARSLADLNADVADDDPNEFDVRSLVIDGTAKTSDA